MPTNGRKNALITGITGQDGSYLAELLLEQGLRGPRPRPPQQLVQHRAASTTSTAIRTSPTRGSSCTTATSPTALGLREILDARAARTRSTTSARRATSASRSTSRCTPADATAWARSACSRRSATPACRAAVLPGVAAREMFGKVAETPQTRDDAVPPAQPVRLRQGLRPLADGQLPRGVRHVRLQRASSSTTRAPRRGETFVTRKITRAAARIKDGLQKKLVPRQPRRQARLGLRRRLRRGDVADAPAGQARRLRRRDRRDALASASSSTMAFGTLGLDWQKYVEIDPRYFRPAEVDVLLGDADQGPEARSGWKPEGRRSRSWSKMMIEPTWSSPSASELLADHDAKERVDAAA